MNRILGLTLLLLTGSVSFCSTPLNDNFANATLLQGTTITTNGNFAGATFEPGEPFSGNPVGGTLWWTFVPTVTGSYSISAYLQQTWLTIPSVKAYTGTSITNLVAFQSFLPANSPQFTLRAAAGQEIRIQVASGHFDATSVTLFIQPGPFHDDFQNALLITSELTTGTTQGASSEPDEPTGQTVWYKWQPDLTTGYGFSLTSLTQPHALTLFEETSFGALTLLEEIESPGILIPDAIDSFTVLAEASKTYYIAIHGLTSYSDMFQLRITPGPPNDTFLNRSLIESLDQPIAVTTRNATREPAEPLHNTNSAPRTVWYEWTAPSTGGFYIEVWSPEPTPGFAIYQGDTLSNLVAVPSITSLSTTADSYGKYVAFRAVAGQMYFIVLADDRSRALAFRLGNSPSHDEFDDPRDISLLTPIQFSVLGATLQPGEPTNNLPAGTVWHRFTAPGFGSYVAVANAGAPLVYRGTALTNLTLAEPASANPSSNIFPFRASPLESFYIAVHLEFPVTYNLRVLPAMDNDDFNFRLPVETGSITTNASWSTLEPDEPIHSTKFTAGSLWWTWTPTNTGTYRIQTIVPNRGSALTVYTGNELTNLTLVARAESPFFYAEGVLIDFHADAGVEYSIAATYLPVDHSPLLLEIHRPPAHDIFSAALPITLHEPRSNTFVVATREPGEITLQGNGSLWYSWTAPYTGPFIFTAHTTPDYHGTDPFACIGSDVTDLVKLRSFHYESNGTHGVAFRADQGSTYRLPVQFLAIPFERTVTVTISPGHSNDDLANAAPLSGTFVGWTNNPFGATTEPDEELSLPFAQSGSTWYRWIAPQSGIFKIVSSAGGETEVYHGHSFADFVSVGITPKLVPSFYRVTAFAAKAGTAYYFRVVPTQHRVSVLRLGPVVPNDSLATATELFGENIYATGQNWTSFFDQRHWGTVWYKWTAPAHGFINYNSGTNQVWIFAYHGKFPTVDSNLIQSASSPARPPLPGTNGVAVTAGMTYYFGLQTSASTKIPFHLQLDERPADLGGLSGALLGGDALWSLQTNSFFSPPDAFQVGPLKPSESAYIEFDVNGPGILKFRTKMTSDNYPGSLTVQGVRAYSRFNIAQFRGIHDWTLRTINITSSYTVIRWTCTSGAHTTTAWLDDIEFIPASPRAPQLSMFIDPATEGHALNLNFLLEANRPTTIDTSTNLINWHPLTNLLSPSSTIRTLQLPAPTNATPQFFRARIEP